MRNFAPLSLAPSRPAGAFPTPIPAARSFAHALRFVLEKTLRNLAIQDLLILVLDAYLLARVWLSPVSPARDAAFPVASSLLVLALAMVLLCRGELLPACRVRAATYRLMALGCFVASYFEMRYVMAGLGRPLLDGALVAIDRALLGETPALALERWVSPATTQWFAFFYYSYIWLLAINLLGSALFDRRSERLQELLLGASFVTAIGHTLYTIVPGIGPHGHLAFQAALPDVFWWRRVLEVVDGAGAGLDIFPSLHTALPAFFALHAIRHRRAQPFRLLWPVAVFFSANIIVSTMFLRWHYAVDVGAGLCLSVLAQRLAVAIARRESRREARGRQPVFEVLGA
jgi:hypothetical protein